MECWAYVDGAQPLPCSVRRDVDRQVTLQV